MTEVLADFIRALRAADVRVSSAESIDAGQALHLVGYDDRQALRHALSQALAKSIDEKAAFEETFDRYFAFDQFTDGPARPEDADAYPNDTADPGKADNDNENAEGSGEIPNGGDGAPGNDGEGAPGQDGEGGEGQGGEGSGGGGGAGGRGRSRRPPDLLALLESGDQARLQMALAGAARQVRLNDIRFFTQRGLYTRRMMEVMGIEGFERVISEFERQGGEDDPRAVRLRAMRETFRLQVRDYVEKQLALFTANVGRKLREETLSEVRLTNIDQSDMKIMRALINKMAKRLVALHSRRKRVTRRGHLDVRRTIRANIEFDGLLFHTVWKRTKIDRPKIIAVCDISGSVARVSRFLLMFLYSVQEVLPNVRSFAFSNRLGEVTKLFREKDPDDAMAETMKVHGGGSTDYGKAFMDLESLAMADIDHRTTVLILGDARSNYDDPRADILKKIHERARRVLFLNPEGKSQWSTGDSEMRRLSPHCDRAIVCASLSDLKRVVTDLMRTAV